MASRGVLDFEDPDADFVPRRQPRQYTAAASYPEVDAQEAAAFPEDVDVDPTEGLAVGPWGEDPHSLGRTSRADEHLDVSLYASEEMALASGGIDDERRRASGPDLDVHSGSAGEGRLVDNIPTLRARSRYPTQTSGHDAPMLEDAEPERSAPQHRFRLASAASSHGTSALAKRPLDLDSAPEGRDTPLVRLPTRGASSRGGARVAQDALTSSAFGGRDEQQTPAVLPRVPRRAAGALLPSGLSLSGLEDAPLDDARPIARTDARSTASRGNLDGTTLLSDTHPLFVPISLPTTSTRGSRIAVASSKTTAQSIRSAATTPELVGDAPIPVRRAPSRSISGRADASLPLMDGRGEVARITHARGHRGTPEGGAGKLLHLNETRIPDIESYTVWGGRTHSSSSTASTASEVRLELLPIVEWSPSSPSVGVGIRRVSSVGRASSNRVETVPLLSLDIAGEDRLGWAPSRPPLIGISSAELTSGMTVGGGVQLGTTSFAPLLHALPSFAAAVPHSAPQATSTGPAHGEPGHVCSNPAHSPAMGGATTAASNAGTSPPLATGTAHVHHPSAGPLKGLGSSGATTGISAGASLATTSHGTATSATAPTVRMPRRSGLAQPATSAGTRAPIASVEEDRGSSTMPQRQGRSGGRLATAASLEGQTRPAEEDGDASRPPARPLPRQMVTFRGGEDVDLEDGHAGAPPRRDPRSRAPPAAATRPLAPKEDAPDTSSQAQGTSLRRAPARTALAGTSRRDGGEDGTLAPPPRSRQSTPADSRSGAAGSDDGREQEARPPSTRRRPPLTASSEAQAGNTRPDTRDRTAPMTRHREAAPGAEGARRAHSDVVASTDEKHFRGMTPPSTLVFRGGEDI
jgi:hypothetical protein